MGRPVPGPEHVLLNRDLFDEFAALLAAAKWDVALLQEVPPRWDERLAAATKSTRFRGLTSRMWLSPVGSPIARVRPQLPGSWEGGSNLILVRKDRPGSAIARKENRTLTWRPERRVVSLVQLADGLCVANLHASTGAERGARDVLNAAEIAVQWAGEAPLVFGGDFNIRPRKSPEAFAELVEHYGFTAPSEEGAIDHLLMRGGEVLEEPASWIPGRRDVPDLDSDLLVRLSDHSPVVSRINT